MTLPTERTNAVVNMELFVRELASFLGPHNEQREKIMIPRELVKNIVRCLRHYPSLYEMQVSAEKCPEIWGENERIEI